MSLSSRIIVAKEMIAVEEELRNQGYIVNSNHDTKKDYHYFIAQSKDGSQVYAQIEAFSSNLRISSKYKPSKNEGSGRNLSYNISAERFLETIPLWFSDAKCHAERYGYPEPIVDNKDKWREKWILTKQ